MIVLGLDPGTATTGYGVIKKDNNSYNVLDFGLIETQKNGDPSKRLLSIEKKLNKIIVSFKPDVIAIEKLFFATNAKTAIRVGQAQGVMLYTSAKNDKKVFEYAPGTIKKIITGDGRADKKMIQKHLRKLLGNHIKSRKKRRTHFDNSADALAVAMCHYISMKK